MQELWKPVDFGTIYQVSSYGRVRNIKTGKFLSGTITRDVNSLFRREDSPYLASDLIRWAVAHTRAVWPDVPEPGIVSFVDAAKTEGKEVPGWCYRRAGWSHVGFTQAGLYVFQQLPGRRIKRRSQPMPEAVPVPGSQMSLFDDAA